MTGVVVTPSVCLRHPTFGVFHRQISATGGDDFKRPSEREAIGKEGNMLIGSLLEGVELATRSAGGR